MLTKVYNYVKTHKLIEKGDRILVGVSGGADSVCLLHILTALYQKGEVDLFVVHVHHGIRNEEADRDEAFVKELSANMGLTYCAYHYDVKGLASKEGLSEEEAGRKARYDAFADASKKYKCNKVATAHNKNDNAETILFNLFRGTGIRGLTGIDPILNMKTDLGIITIIRPLLSTEREDIEKYLSGSMIKFINDSTNFQDIYSRNKIRNQILSYANEHININVIDHITNAGVHLRESYNYINSCIHDRYRVLVREGQGYFEYDVSDFDREDIVIQKGIIRKIFQNLAGKLRNIEANHVNDVLDLGKKQVGKQLNLPYGMIAMKKYGIVRITTNSDGEDSNFKSIRPIEIQVPGKTYLEQIGAYIETDIIDYEKNKSIPKNSCIKWFDYDKIENTLLVRARKTGDFLQINSRGGRKKLKDYLIDLKVPKNDRDSLLLLADENHILWIIGHDNRISEKFKIGDNTKNILSMKLTYAKEKDND